MSIEIKGFATVVAKQKTGTNNNGEWSVQYITVKTEGGDKKVCVWNRADLSSAKGKHVTISGLEEGQDQKGNEILVLNAGKGGIEAKEVQRTTQASAQKNVEAGKYTRPTQAEYERILGRVIGNVFKTFHDLAVQVDGAGAKVDQAAVAHVTNGVMVAYSKGDFLVEVAQAAEAKQAEPKKDAPPADDDIPF